MRGRLDLDTAPRILAHPSIPGHVYAQCSDVSELKNVLVNLSDVLHQRGLTIVQSGEREQLLDPSRRFTTGTWVRLKDGACRGYRHSIARIVTFVEASDSWRICLIRKADTKGKRKRQRKNIDEDPVLKVDVPSESLERIDPSLDDILPFFALRIAPASALRAAIPFRSGDLVKVVSGEQAGLIGTLSMVAGSTAEVKAKALGDDKDTCLEVSLSLIEPHFTQGDHVEVLAGMLKGMVGWVMNSVDGIVTIQVSPQHEVCKHHLELNVADFCSGTVSRPSRILQTSGVQFWECPVTWQNPSQGSRFTNREESTHYRPPVQRTFWVY
jgi:ribosomal protein L24